MKIKPEYELGKWVFSATKEEPKKLHNRKAELYRICIALTPVLPSDVAMLPKVPNRLESLLVIKKMPKVDGYSWVSVPAEAKIEAMKQIKKDIPDYSYDTWYYLEYYQESTLAVMKKNIIKP